MCEPTSAALMYASIAATAGSTLLQVQSARQQAKHTQAVGEYNARVQENQAQEVRNKGIDAENQARSEARQLQSRQAATQAARGVLTTEGTAFETQQDTKLIGDINALRIRQNTESQVGALETGATLTRSDAAGRAASANNQAFTSALAGAGAVAGKWYQFNNTVTPGA